MLLANLVPLRGGGWPEPKEYLKVIMKCSSCGADDARQLCSACEGTRYCDRACQARHWKCEGGRHKDECQGMIESGGV
jgi:hypothetical protein